MHALQHSVPPTLEQATTDPYLCWRLLDTHGHVWVSFLWGHCSLLLGPGAHKVLLVLSKSLFPQSFVRSGGSVVGLMVISSKRAYAIPSSAAPRVPAVGYWWPVSPRRHSDTVLAQSLSVGCVFCSLLKLNSSGDQVLGKYTVPGGPRVLITSLVPATQLPRCMAKAPSQVCRMSLLGSWSQGVTLLADVNHPGSQKDVSNTWKNLDSLLKYKDSTLPTMGCIVKAMAFPVVMYGYESWTIKNAECLRIDAFKLWCWRRLLRILWYARRSN